MEIQIVTSVRNLLQFIIMNGHTIAMGLFKKDAKECIDRESEKMVKKMGREAEGKVRMVSLVYEGKGSFHHSPTFSLGIRSPFVAAVVHEAVQVNFMRVVVMVMRILMLREPPGVGGVGWRSTWWQG